MFEDILFGVAVFLVVRLLSIKHKSVSAQYNLPPGPKPLAVLGYTLLYMKVKDVSDSLQVLADMLKEAGEGILFLNTYVAGNLLTISKPQDLETMLTNRHNYHKSSLLYPKMTALPDGLVTISGEQWKTDRRLVSPVFKTRTLNTFAKVFSKISYNLVKDLSRFADGTSFHCEPVYSLHLFNSILENMCGIGELPFSQSYIQQYIHEVEREFDHASEAVIKFYTDPVRRLTKYKKTAEEFKQRITDMSYKLLSSRKEMDGHDREDIDREKTYLERISGLSEKYFVGEMNTAIVAGYETTAVTMSYVSAMLGVHKHYQELVYQELREILGDTDRELEPEDLSRMKMLEYCINETMRLCPTVPAVARQLSTDMQFGKYSVPRGTHVYMVFFVTHRDPEQWERPNEFYPQHFTPDNVKKRHPYAFLPFSAGNRQCLGYRYAMMSMKAGLANIIRHYNIDTDMVMPDLKITRFFTLDASYIKIKLTPRIEHIHTVTANQS